MGEAAKLFTRSLMMGLDSAVRKNEFAELTAEDVENLPYAEAVEYLKKRDVIKKVDYNKLSDKMRFRAFTASRIADGDLLKRINSELIKNVNDGKGLKDFLALTKTDILNKIGMGASGQGWYWETVYRTNVQTAYNTGRMMGFEEDKPLALHFVGIEDSRQTDICHSLSNVIRPYDDPLWEKYIPPLHFGCRSTVRAIYDEDELPDEWSSLEGIEKPAKGFGTNPLENDSWWNELSSQVARAKEYGVQGEIEDVKKILFEPKSVMEITNPKQSGTDASKNYIPFETKEECQKFLLDNFGITADYSQMDVYVANRYNETIVNVRNVFGNDSLRRLKFISKMPKNEPADVPGAYSSSKNTLYLRKTTKNGLEKIGHIAWSQKHNGFWTTSSPFHVLRHELGHAVADSMASVVSKKYKAIHELWMETVEKHKPWEYADVLSRRGMEDCDEFIAESVAEYLNGSPRKIARQVVEILLKEE